MNYIVCIIYYVWRNAAELLHHVQIQINTIHLDGYVWRSSQLGQSSQWMNMNELFIFIIV